MKLRISSLALMFLSMALTLHLTDQVVRHSQEVRPDTDHPAIEYCLNDRDMAMLPRGGIGALVESEPAGVRIVSLLPGHAGDLAGLKLGDRIVAVNGESVANENAIGAVRALRGKIGSKVTVDVERGSGIWQHFFRAEIERRDIDVEHSVYSRLRGDELVVRILWLDQNTAPQLINHLAQVHDSKIKEVVLDLTHLSVATENMWALERVAEVFVPSGTVLGYYGTKTDEYEYLSQLTTRTKPAFTGLTAVKIGPYTAKGGELLARVLADKLSVTVSGEASAGLGVIHSNYDYTIKSRALCDNSVHRHGAELFDANKRPLNGHPLKPDFWSWSNLLAPIPTGLK